MGTEVPPASVIGKYKLRRQAGPSARRKQMRCSKARPGLVTY
jgi:hypothetical protein